MSEPCRHQAVVIEAGDDDEATGVRCPSCGQAWPLDGAPADLVARAVALLLGLDDHPTAEVLWSIRREPAIRRIEVVDLLAQAVELDAFRDAR